MKITDEMWGEGEIVTEWRNLLAYNERNPQATSDTTTINFQQFRNICKVLIADATEPTPEMIEALMANQPSPYESDSEDREAFARMFRAAIRARHATPTDSIPQEK